MVVQIMTVVPFVPQVPSAFCSGLTGFHLLYCCVPASGVALCNERSALLAAFAHPLSRCDPCSFRPPLLHSSCTAAQHRCHVSAQADSVPRIGKGRCASRTLESYGLG